MCAENLNKIARFSKKTAFVLRINRNQVSSGNYGFLRNDRLKRKILSGNRFRAQTGGAGSFRKSARKIHSEESGIYGESARTI